MARRFPLNGDFYSVSPGFPVKAACQGIYLDGVCQGVTVPSPGIFDLLGGGVAAPAVSEDRLGHSA